MKRRDFFVNSASAAAVLGTPVFSFFSDNSGIKIGILPQVFRASGYDSFNNSKSITHYSSFNAAYLDLLEERIDVLVTSPTLLSPLKPEFSLLNAQVSTNDEVNRKWLQQSHSYVSEFHAQNGLKSDLVGHFSPLKIRISNLRFEELSQWKGRQKAVSVAASGVDAAIFEHMGFYVRQEPSTLKLSMQLVEQSQNHLNLTNAYAPALFLNAFAQNEKINVYPCAPPLENLVMVDKSSGAGTAIELVYKEGSSAKEIEKLRKSLQSSLLKDDLFQNAALNTILKIPNFSFAEQLPTELRKSMAAYGDIYINALKERVNVDLALLNNFESLKGES